MEQGDRDNGQMLQNRAFSLMAWALADVLPHQVVSGMCERKRGEDTACVRVSTYTHDLDTC